jgi:tetratricopeptide (TPR) repeat protein
VAHNKIGDTYMAQGELKAALESYLAAYGLVQDLVGSDQTNEQWQRDLASCQHRVGGVFLAVGNTSGALDMYGAAVKVEERLASIEGENTTLLRDLAHSHGHLAQTLVQILDYPWISESLSWR